MNDQDFDKLAQRSIDIAPVLRERGVQALRRSAAWRNTAHPMREGEGAPTVRWSDLDKPDPLRHARIVAAVGAYDTAMATLNGLLLDTVPKKPEAARPEDCPEGACMNCWLDRRHFEPVSHYAQLCRWCGDFKATEGRCPPLALLRKRHAGQRVTTQDVERALGRSA